MSILCKTGLHKYRKVKSTKTTVIKLMIDILKERGERVPTLNKEEIICRKFGVDRNTLWIGYDIYMIMFVFDQIVIIVISWLPKKEMN